MPCPGFASTTAAALKTPTSWIGCRVSGIQLRPERFAFRRDMRIASVGALRGGTYSIFWRVMAVRILFFFHLILESGCLDPRPGDLSSYGRENGCRELYCT